MISSTAEAVEFRNRLDAEGKKLVFTNGCFDLLHVGHVRYLDEARALGDALMIALNSDDSVRAIKGPTRPVYSAEDRAEILKALRCVDSVIIFEDERVTQEITAIRPHIYAKGGDYTPETLNPEEKAALDAAGSDIRILQLVPGKSTSTTLSKMKQGHDRKLRLGVLGSGRGSNFESILRAIQSGELEDVEVAVVLSDRKEARILELARENGIEAVYVDPGPYRTKLDAPAQKEVRDRLVAAGVDLVVLAGFMRIVKAEILSSFPERIINIHPSLLPKFRGLHAWKQALEAGEKETGCTVHFVDAGMDTGPILAQEKVPILEGDTANSLQKRIQEKEHILFPHVIGELAKKIRKP